MQLPANFIQAIQSAPGFDEASFTAAHLQQEIITSIRINPAKNNWTSPAQQSSIGTEVPWNIDGYYLSERPSFTLDPLFHAGCYYVQEASSMFLRQALLQTTDVTQPLKVLDLCAAPGGKSTLLQSIISQHSLLVSNEVIKTRATILAENITKWGAANVIVTNNDPNNFQRLPEFFDVVVIDAPCSGSGLFRKDPQAFAEWSEQNVTLCSQRQQRIIADIMPALAQEGLLIYSTCSYSVAEDEAIADWMVDTFHLEPVPLKVSADWGIVETHSDKHNAAGYRFFPGQVKGEGFYLAAFRKKTTASESAQKKSPKKNLERLAKKELSAVSAYLQHPDDFVYLRQNDEAIALPLLLEPDFNLVHSSCYIKKAGVRLGQTIREELLPDHELAMSHLLQPAVQSVAVDLETALQYLRRQEIQMETTLRGWTLLTFKQVPLGWIKILPNRINNYYPKEWRILNK